MLQAATITAIPTKAVFIAAQAIDVCRESMSFPEGRRACRTTLETVKKSRMEVSPKFSFLLVRGNMELLTDGFFGALQ